MNITGVKNRSYEIPERPHPPINRVPSGGGRRSKNLDDNFSDTPPPLPFRMNNRPLPAEPVKKHNG